MAQGFSRLHRDERSGLAAGVLLGLGLATAIALVAARALPGPVGIRTLAAVLLLTAGLQFGPWSTRRRRRERAERPPHFEVGVVSAEATLIGRAAQAPRPARKGS
jgi:hypothetical protein